VSSNYGHQFDLAIWHLNHEFKPDPPIHIYTVPLPVLTKYHGGGTVGDATLSRVRIARGMSIERAVDCLVHEYAHAIHLRENPAARIEHSDAWGVIYSRCYRAVFD
jgi:hypothetical protein